MGVPVGWADCFAAQGRSFAQVPLLWGPPLAKQLPLIGSLFFVIDNTL